MLNTLFAMAPAGGAQGGGGGLMAFLPMILIIFIMYLLILRPQARRQKEHNKMLSEIQKGDKVVTGGGIHGTVVKVIEEDNTILVKISENVKIEVDRSSVSRKIVAGGGSIKPK